MFVTQECFFPNFRRLQTEKKKIRKNKKSILDVLANTKCPASLSIPACLRNRTSSRSDAIIFIQAWNEQPQNWASCSAWLCLWADMGYPAKTLISAGLIPVTVLSIFLPSEFCKQHLKELAAGARIICEHTIFISFCSSVYFISLSYFEKVCPKWCFCFHTLQLWTQAGLCCGRNVLHNLFFFLNTWGNTFSQLFHLFPHLF